jgi:hypothetical protein
MSVFGGAKGAIVNWGDDPISTFIREGYSVRRGKEEGEGRERGYGDFRLEREGSWYLLRYCYYRKGFRIPVADLPRSFESVRATEFCY